MNQLEDVTVLVLDGHRHMRAIIRTLLRGFGARNLVECESIDEAIAALEVSAIDVALVDYYVGEQHGSNFVRAVRKLDQNPHRFMPLISCSASTTMDVIRDMTDAGVDEFLIKPLSARALWQRINIAMEDRRHFVRAPNYFGPDRRRRKDSYEGENKRSQPPKYVEPPSRDKMRKMIRTLFAQNVEF
ncbi:MAG: response regulator [Caulobacterales bacterium]|nr:response regulator [Caulobacterales bacterium]